MDEVRYDEMRVVVTDTKGNTFHRDWKKTAKQGAAITWTLQSQDIDYYIVGDIKNIEIIYGEEN